LKKNYGKIEKETEKWLSQIVNDIPSWEAGTLRPEWARDRGSGDALRFSFLPELTGHAPHSRFRRYAPPSIGALRRGSTWI